MKGNWAIGIGSAIGSCIAFPLLLNLFNTYYYAKNDAVAATVTYVQQSSSIKVNIPAIFPVKKWKIPVRFSKSGNDDLYIREQVFYLPAYKKYFAYEQYDFSFLSDIDGKPDTLVNKPVMVRVNNNDLHDTQLGTRLKPIPVFNIWHADPLILQNKQTGLKDTIYPNFNQNNYKFNVRMYLTYIMTKADFKKRFKR